MGESEGNPGESGAETQAPQPRFPLELGHLWPVSLPRASVRLSPP